MRTFIISKTHRYRLFFVIGSSLLFFAVSGYRPYPSIDDFAYIPFLLKSIDQTLFKGDLAIEQFNNHHEHLFQPIKLLMLLLPLPLILFILTLLLAVGTGWIVYLFMRRLGGSGNMLPLLLYGTGGTILIGIGRGSYDGLFGHAFHPHWIGLLMLLIAYLFLFKNYDLMCGLFLGIAIYAHIMNAAHGFVVIAIALIFESVFNKKPIVRRFFTIFGIAFLFGLPRIILLSPFLSQTFTSTVSTASSDVFHDLIVFRFPHEHTEFLSWQGYLSGSWLLLMGVAAMIIAYSLWKKDMPLIAGLLAGHALLLGCYIMAGWVLTSSLPAWVHRLHFSRTTPILIFLLNLVVVASIESVIPRLSRGNSMQSSTKADFSRDLMGLILLASYVLWCFFSGVVNRWFLCLPFVLFLIPIIQEVQSITFLRKIFITLLLMIALTGIAIQTREVPIEASEQELFHWIQHSTKKEKVFITPPTFSHFRMRSKRPVYASFRPFYALNKEVAYELKARLIQTCNPDGEALEKGWKALPQWERSYLRRNPPDRIAQLLAETEASYWLQDRKSMTIPPYYPALATDMVPFLNIAFSNERFTVYTLMKGQQDDS